MPTRRKFLLSALAAAGTTSLGIGLYSWRVEPHWLQITRPRLPVRELPVSLEGRTLAQLSDLHVGPRVADDYVVDSLRRVSALEPDFVVFTGDWLTWRGPGQFDQLRRALEHMPHGRLGTVGILGNHDYGFGWRMLEVADKITEIATAAGVQLLRNQATTIAGLQFLGFDDFWSPRFGPVPLLAGRNPNLATLVLCHNPDVADAPVWQDYQGWILAGHTHGGQCKPPFLPPPVLPVVNKRYTAGEIPVSGNRRLYISRGIGHLLRVRFNVRPEVPLFRLERA
jgi:uncharacterized protein